MIAKTFETDRPVFFITDKDKFSPVIVDMTKDVSTSSDSTIAITCSIITDDLENTIYLYIDEHFDPNDEMEFVSRTKLSISSHELEIIDSDDEYIFTERFEVDEIFVELYVNKNHDLMPEEFFIVIHTEYLIS